MPQDKNKKIQFCILTVHFFYVVQPHIAMPSQPSSVIEILDNTPIIEWIEDEWIGKGKIYPASDVPLFIQTTCSRVLAIPSTYATYPPSWHLSVTDLLKVELVLPQS